MSFLGKIREGYSHGPVGQPGACRHNIGDPWIWPFHLTPDVCLATVRGLTHTQRRVCPALGLEGHRPGALHEDVLGKKKSSPMLV